LSEEQTTLIPQTFDIGIALRDSGKPEEAVTAWYKALAIQQKLADANPAVAESQLVLARTNGNLGSGFGLGQTFLGTLKVTTGANGVATINTTFARTFRSGTFITATATLPGSGTSEFSKCLQVP
jgi:hypothetical protein